MKRNPIQFLRSFQEMGADFTLMKDQIERTKLTIKKTINHQNSAIKSPAKLDVSVFVNM